MRAIFEALGAEIEWDGTTQTVTGTKDSSTITLRIGSNTATVNGQQQNLDQPAVVQSSRTLVPLRFVGEALGVSRLSTKKMFALLI